ncbi:50S ribosomal protein L3 [PVC group bacterium (ex Bugula neritina AB1)]|nr:50S ribosomal protein L3 [PVC group bacterium (ex Bugula neritina AB1)]
MIGVCGKKLGMTRLYNALGEVLPVTVVEALSGVVIRKKFIDKDGYDAVQVGYGDKKKSNLNKPDKGYFAKQNLKPKDLLREFKVDNIDEFEVGQVLDTKDLFSTGSFVDVTGTSKGKGFAGVIKRHGFSRGPETHGSRHHREPGSVGSTGPSRVFKGKKLPGRKGNKAVTVQNLKVVKVDPQAQLIYLVGAVPGNRFGWVTIKPAVKKQKDVE